MASLRSKLLLAAIVTAVQGAAAYGVYAWWRDSRAGATVELVDNRAAVIETLEQRARAPEGPPETVDSFPPPLRREPLDPSTARVFFPFVGRGDFHPYLYYSHEAHTDTTRRFPEHPDGEYRIQTNALGMREVDEVADPRPRYRVIVTGDSHTDGVCSNEENFSSRLEASFERDPLGPDSGVEVLNCACFGYSLYQYLAVIEKYEHLRPDVFVVAVYGGNDFYSMMTLQRYFHRRPPPEVRSPAIYMRIRGKEEKGVVAQEFQQAQYFLDNPDDVDVAIATACSITLEIERTCREQGVTPMFVYIPPPYRGQPELNRDDRDHFLALAGFDAAALQVSDEIADGWLGFVRERELALVDLREPFRRETRRLYYRADHHINVAAHAVISLEIEPMLRRMLLSR